MPGSLSRGARAGTPTICFLRTVFHLRTFTPRSRRFLLSAFLWGFAFSVTWLYLNFLFENLGFSDSLVGAHSHIAGFEGKLSVLDHSEVVR